MHSKNWLYEEYKTLYENATGSKPLDDEKSFLQDFFDPYNEGEAKTIYYMAIFRLKRGWYRFLVLYFIKRALKKEFKKDENLKILVSLHSVFAKKMLNDAIKAYCKIND
jgi:hypothetical protein